jgi:DNA ligase (NAD+)
MNDLFSSLEIKKRIDELVDLLNKYNEAYYQQNESLVSDFEYDQLYQELKELEAKYPEFKRSDSPTEIIGEKPTKEFKQVVHKIPMLSLANTYTVGEINDFIRRAREAIPDEEIEFTADLKYDGAAITIVYENGRLKYAATRGNGNIGDDITQNIKTIKTIPKLVNEVEISGKKILNFEVRGEVYIKTSDFLKINKERVENGEKLFANPRNLASGTIKTLDSKIVAERPLQVVCYHLYTEDVELTSQYENYQIMQKLGLPSSNFIKKCNNIDELLNYINHWEIKRFEIDFQIDGIVIKIDSIKQQEKLGAVTKTPRWAIAYKYAPETVETLLKDITLQVGRTGAVTPVAELEPVYLAGSTISRATLHNYDYIKERDIRIGDFVIIEKGGEVIPKIVRPVLEKRSPDIKPFIFPEYCPCSLRSKLVRVEGEANYYCIEPKCPWQLRRKIEHFVSRDAMNIEGLGEKIIEMLIEKGFISSIPGIYELHLFQDKLIALENWGEKKVRNLLNAIEKSKKQPFENVLFALGIRYVGKTVSKILCKHFKNIDSLIAASVKEISSIYEIGEKIAQSVNDFFKNSSNLEMISKLKEKGLNFSISDDIQQVQNKLNGATFVFTGELSTMTRNDAAKLVEKYGGREVKSISKNTSYVVVGENPGSKYQKALELNLKILNEEEFLKLINE